MILRCYLKLLSKSFVKEKISGRVEYKFSVVIPRLTRFTTTLRSAQKVQMHNIFSLFAKQTIFRYFRLYLVACQICNRQERIFLKSHLVCSS